MFGALSFVFVALRIADKRIVVLSLSVCSSLLLAYLDLLFAVRGRVGSKAWGVGSKAWGVGLWGVGSVPLG